MVVPYSPVQRYVDKWHARRDGKAGLPLPSAMPLSTPHRDRLIACAQERCEAVLLAYRAVRADYQRRWEARLAAVRQAETELAQAKDKVRESEVRPSDEVLAKRTLGEEHRSDDIVRQRRLREHAQKVLRAQEVVKAAQAEVKRRKRELNVGRARLRLTARAAGIRVRHIHRHCHRRIAAYRKALAHNHLLGGMVEQGMDVLEPVLPGWLRGDAAQPPAPQSAVDDWFDAEPVGDRFPIRAGLVIGSCDRADIVLDGYGIAAEHAVVRRRGDRLVLKDMRRGDRAFVASRPSRRIGLDPGVVFDLADQRFQVDDGGDHLIKTPASGYGLVVSELSSQVVTATGLEPELTRVTFGQPANTVLAVLEPTRSGRSALFPALLGALPCSGAMYFHGLNMRLHGQQITTWTRFVPRQSRLRGGWTVRKVLEHADRSLRPSGVKRDRTGLMRAPVRRVCRLFDLESIADYRMDALRPGQRKRVSIALEVLAGPRLLLLDEPMAGLDRAAAKKTTTGLGNVANGGCTVVLTTGSMRELSFVDQVVVIGTKGSVVFSGAPDALPAALGVRDDRALRELLKKSTDELARAYAASPHAAQARARAAAADQKAWQTTGVAR